MEQFHAIVPAAGTSARMGVGPGESKLLIPVLADKSVFELSLLALERSEVVSEITVCCRGSEAELFKEIAKKSLSTPVHFVSGGATRQESVFNGLNSVRESADYVLVHDAARPCVSSASIRAVCQSAVETGAAILALPAHSTVKESRDSKIVSGTHPREKIWLAQTPQAFKTEVLHAAYLTALEDGFQGTDESSLVEHAGGKVRLVKGTISNIKITETEDLELAKAILKIEY